MPAFFPGGGSRLTAAEGHFRAPTGSRATIVSVGLARIPWLVTVAVCLITVLTLVLDGYYGYAGVTLAVALAATINIR